MSRCYCGMERVPGETCRHGAPPEADRRNLQAQARKRKENAKRGSQRTGGFPTHREVQEAVARIAPIEARHRAFWTRRPRGAS